MNLEEDFEKCAQEYPTTILDKECLLFEEQFLMALYQVLVLNEANAKEAITPKLIEACESAFDMLGAVARLLDSLKVVPANN